MCTSSRVLYGVYPRNNATTTSSTKQFIAGVEVVAVKLFRIFSVAVDFEAGGVAEEPGQARRERRARRNERFASAMQATRSLAELIKGSRGKFADVLQEMELVVHVPLEGKVRDDTRKTGRGGH